MSLDTNGWVEVRPPHTDRIIEGAFLCEIRDTQGDLIPTSVFLKRIEDITNNVPLVYRHGRDPTRGVVVLSPYMSAYKIENGKAHARFAINKGNPVVDKIWDNEIKVLADRAGFSIGGVVPPGGANCERKGGIKQCDISDCYICEISWTPHPVNPQAKISYVNTIAKGDYNMSEEEKIEKQAGLASAVLSAAMQGAQVIASTPPAKPAGGAGQTTTIEEKEDEKKKKDALVQKVDKGCDKVKECVKAVLRDNPEYSEERAWAICNAKFGKGNEDELENRIYEIYKSLPGPFNVLDAISGCGTCDDYVRLQIEKGTSVAQAFLKLQNIFSRIEKEKKSDKKDDEKDDEDEDKKDEKRGDKVSDEKVPPEKPFDVKKAFEDLKAELLGVIRKEIEAAVAKATVGTGTPPLEGVPTSTPETVDQTTMTTTKEDELKKYIETLVAAGYVVKKAEKAVPDNVPGGRTSPSGIQKEGLANKQPDHPAYQRVMKFLGKR